VAAVCTAMGKKQLVYICRDPVKTVAGDVVYVRAHARLAVEAGFEPHIFCAGRRDEVVATDFGVIHRVWSPFRPFRAVAMPLHTPFIARAIIRFLLTSTDPFLIHGFGAWTYAGARASRSLRARGRVGTLIATTYDTHEREARARLAGTLADHGRLHRLQNRAECLWTVTAVAHFERRAYQDAEMVIVNYESVRNALLDGYVTNDKIRLAPYTTEAALLYQSVTNGEKESSSDAPLIVAVSRHDGRKGVDVLVRSLAELRGAGVPFRADLVGAGPLFETHQRLAQRLGLGPELRLSGRVEDSFSHLRAGDVFVLPSLEEGSGSMSMLEAMQCGLAIVATDIDGIPEDVVDEDSALLVPPGDHLALARALERVLVDKDLRKRLSRRAREEFERRFSLEPFRRWLIQTYAELGFVP
jgi:glycosyltransferase involved in cell wall biosynthesis